MGSDTLPECFIKLITEEKERREQDG
jgi:hypothetical protein